MGLILLAGMLALGRPFTEASAAAASLIAIAAAISGGVAALAARWLGRRVWTARFAALLLILMVGTAGLTAFFLTIHMVWRAGHLTEVPLHVIGWILATLGAASLYYVLAITGHFLLPLGLPLIVVVALVLAGRRR